MLRFSFLKVPAALGLGLLLAAALAGPVRAADPPAVWAGPPQVHAVALTFDDGPTPQYTWSILSLLHQYGAHATFFVIGRKAEASPELVRALLAAGNEVGNHTFSHPHLVATGELGRERELERTAVDLDLLGCPPGERLFRPPYSAYDHRLADYLAHTERRLVLWSIDSGDWRGLAAPAIVANVLSRVRNGAIIIFHDGDETGRADRSPTLAALRQILPALKASGYRMVTVSGLLDAGH